MSTVPKRLLTPAEYLACERAAEHKSEFYAGEMFAMPGASRSHSLICSSLVAFLRRRLRSFGCEVHGSDMRVKVSNTGLYTYPDVSVVCGDIQFDDEHEDVLRNPCVIVEVLSKSTERRDRGWKFQQYRKLPSLREYLLVAQERAAVERFWRHSEGSFEFDDVEGLDGVLRLKTVELDLPLREVYLDVALGGDGESSPDEV
jgi:Uma2 family endonuclease